MLSRKSRSPTKAGALKALSATLKKEATAPAPAANGRDDGSEPAPIDRPSRACTLQDLCPEDKQKISKLLKQIVELGKENEQLKSEQAKAKEAAQQLDQQAAEAREKLQATCAEANARADKLGACARQLARENVSLKGKLAQMLTVLKTYQEKVHVMDAALQASALGQVLPLGSQPAAAPAAAQQAQPSVAVPSTVAVQPAGMPAAQAPGLIAEGADGAGREVVAPIEMSDTFNAASAAAQDRVAASSTVGISGMGLMTARAKEAPSGVTTASPGEASALGATAAGGALRRSSSSQRVQATEASRLPSGSGQGLTPMPSLLTVPYGTINITIQQGMAGGAASAISDAAAALQGLLPQVATVAGVAGVAGVAQRPSELQPTGGVAGPAAGDAGASGGQASATREHSRTAGREETNPQGSLAEKRISSAAAAAAAPIGSGNRPAPAEATQPVLDTPTLASASQQPGPAGEAVPPPSPLLPVRPSSDAASMPVSEQTFAMPSQEAPPASPLLVAPGDSGTAGIPARLLAWQVQHGVMPASAAGVNHGQGGDGDPEGLAVAATSKVLRFDPAIGQHGAFYLTDVNGHGGLAVAAGRDRCSSAGRSGADQQEKEPASVTDGLQYQEVRSQPQLPAATGSTTNAAGTSRPTLDLEASAGRAHKASQLGTVTSAPSFTFAEAGRSLRQLAAASEGDQPPIDTCSGAQPTGQAQVGSQLAHPPGQATLEWPDGVGVGCAHGGERVGLQSSNGHEQQQHLQQQQQHQQQPHRQPIVQRHLRTSHSSSSATGSGFCNSGTQRQALSLPGVVPSVQGAILPVQTDLPSLQSVAGSHLQQEQWPPSLQNQAPLQHQSMQPPLHLPPHSQHKHESLTLQHNHQQQPFHELSARPAHPQQMGHAQAQQLLHADHSVLHEHMHLSAPQHVPWHAPQHAPQHAHQNAPQHAPQQPRQQARPVSSGASSTASTNTASMMQMAVALEAMAAANAWGTTPLHNGLGSAARKLSQQSWLQGAGAGAGASIGRPVHADGSGQAGGRELAVAPYGAAVEYGVQPSASTALALQGAHAGHGGQDLVTWGLDLAAQGTGVNPKDGGDVALMAAAAEVAAVAAVAAVEWSQRLSEGRAEPAGSHCRGYQPDLPWGRLHDGGVHGNVSPQQTTVAATSSSTGAPDAHFSTQDLVPLGALRRPSLQHHHQQQHTQWHHQRPGYKDGTLQPGGRPDVFPAPDVDEALVEILSQVEDLEAELAGTRSPHAPHPLSRQVQPRSSGACSYANSASSRRAMQAGKPLAGHQSRGNDVWYEENDVITAILMQETT